MGIVLLVPDDEEEFAAELEEALAPVPDDEPATGADAADVAEPPPELDEADPLLLPAGGW